MAKRVTMESHPGRKLAWLVVMSLAPGIACACTEADPRGLMPGSPVGIGGAAGGAISGTAGGGMTDRGPYVEPKDPVDVTQIPLTVPTVSLAVAAELARLP
jgi:hypothetical protein